LTSRPSTRCVAKALAILVVVCPSLVPLVGFTRCRPLVVADQECRSRFSNGGFSNALLQHRLTDNGMLNGRLREWSRLAFEAPVLRARTALWMIDAEAISEAIGASREASVTRMDFSNGRMPDRTAGIVEKGASAEHSGSQQYISGSDITSRTCIRTRIVSFTRVGVSRIARANHRDHRQLYSAPLSTLDDVNTTTNVQKVAGFFGIRIGAVGRCSMPPLMRTRVFATTTTRRTVTTFPPTGREREVTSEWSRLHLVDLEATILSSKANGLGTVPRVKRPTDIPSCIGRELGEKQCACRGR